MCLSIRKSLLENGIILDRPASNLWLQLQDVHAKRPRMDEDEEKKGGWGERREQVAGKKIRNKFFSRGMKSSYSQKLQGSNVGSSAASMQHAACTCLLATYLVGTATSQVPSYLLIKCKEESLGAPATVTSHPHLIHSSSDGSLGTWIPNVGTSFYVVRSESFRFDTAMYAIQQSIMRARGGHVYGYLHSYSPLFATCAHVLL